MITTMTDTQAEIYLDTRAYNEGISVDDLLDMTPSSVADNPVESAMFWQQRDYSHKLPTSQYPWLSDDPDNAMPEDPSVNRSRGAEEMTEMDILIAEEDNEVLAQTIDIIYSGDDTTVIPDFVPFFGF